MTRFHQPYCTHRRSHLKWATMAIAGLTFSLIDMGAAAAGADVMLQTPASIQLAAWCSSVEDGRCRQTIADQAQAHCQAASHSNAQLASSTLMERSLFKGERLFFIFNCVR